MAARLRPASPTSSSAAASAWPAIWPSSPSSAAAPRPTAPRSRRPSATAIAADRTSRRDLMLRRRQRARRRSTGSSSSSGSSSAASMPKAKGPAAWPSTASEQVQPDDQRRRSSADPGDAQRPRPATPPGSRSTASTTCSTSRSTYAFHDRLGYLTACPTNVGTGMRVSVMLHLPALVITRQIEKVFRSLQKISLAVRGLYGEGSQAMGDFYQISNQITLGRSEDRPGQASRRRRAGASSTTSARPASFLVKESQQEPARPRQPGLRHSAARRRRSAPKRRCTCSPACGWASTWA